MPNSTPTGKTPFVDNPRVKESFGDGLAGFTLTNGVLKITFTTVRADHSKNPARHSAVVSARIAIPLPTMVELHKMLGEIIDQLKEQGVLQVVQGGTTSLQ